MGSPGTPPLRYRYVQRLQLDGNLLEIQPNLLIGNSRWYLAKYLGDQKTINLIAAFLWLEKLRPLKVNMPLPLVPGIKVYEPHPDGTIQLLLNFERNAIGKGEPVAKKTDGILIRVPLARGQKDGELPVILLQNKELAERDILPTLKERRIGMAALQTMIYHAIRFHKKFAGATTDDANRRLNVLMLPALECLKENIGRLPEVIAELGLSLNPRRFLLDRLGSKSTIAEELSNLT